MTISSYLYTFTITTICLIIFLAYLICFVINRSRHCLLMTGLFASYLFSELVRILDMLGASPLLVSLSAETMLVFYFLILWEQSALPAKGLEAAYCIVTIVIPVVLDSIPGAYLRDNIFPLMVFLWGAQKLKPVYKRDRRTEFTFWLCVSFVAFFSIVGLLSLVLPLDILFTPNAYSLTNLTSEWMFYVIIVASLADLLFLFRGLKPKTEPAPTPVSSPLAAIAEEYCLSPREQEVFALIADGKSAKEISQTLFISEGTVKVHTHNIYQKLNISSRRQIYQLLLEYPSGSQS